MKRVFVFVLGFLSALFCDQAIAQTIDSLDAGIRNVDSQIERLNQQYESLKKVNENHLQRQELREAYAGAERLTQINSQLNQLKTQKQNLCEQWHSLYRKTVDDLLAAANEESDRKKKAEIGRKLQHYQSRNIQLCAESFPELLSQEWKHLRIESYDGPHEIDQKIQLLRDLSREAQIRLTKLDSHYQETLREQRTKERAQEFIEEGTLFTEGITVRSSTTHGGSNPSSTSVESPGGPAGNSGSSGESTVSVGIQSWQSPDQFEAQYAKNRAELLSEQKELQKKIEEFQKARSLLVP